LSGLMRVGAPAIGQSMPASQKKATA